LQELKLSFDVSRYINDGDLIRACLRPGNNPLASFVAGFAYDLHKLDLIRNGAARARAILLMLENYRHNPANANGGMVAEWAGTFTAEHVLPKVSKNMPNIRIFSINSKLNPINYIFLQSRGGADISWHRDFSAEEHHNVVNLLGNLTILSARDNLAASSSAFSEKKIIYQRQNILIAAELARIPHFTLDALFARHKELIIEAAIK
jgi:hypothetical protein